MNIILEQFKKLKKEDRIMFFLVFTTIGNTFMRFDRRKEKVHETHDNQGSSQ